MSDSDLPVKKHELDRVSERFEDHKHDADTAHTEIKQDAKDFKTEVKDTYVTNDKLKIELAPHESIRKFFWWVAGGVGAMFLATVYQFIMNGIKL